MKVTRLLSVAALALAVGACEQSGDRISGAPPLSAVASANQNIGINVLLSGPPTAVQLAELGTYGNVHGRITEINAVFMHAGQDQLPAIRGLSYVLAANPDAERKGGPVDAVSATDFANGLNTWDLDAVNVTNFGAGRVAQADGSGVYVGVLDTGLLDSWRQYFPQERIATQFAKAFSGGGQNEGNVSEPPNQWEHDQNSHGTHVTSTILGYSLRGVPINGTAPKATVIPVKVLNQAGFGWSSMIATGIVYVANLKAGGALGAAPVVINMSLGGPALDAVEKAAIDFAIARGVVIVAAAGNEGAAGMSFPGAYAPVISAAASGWVGEWKTCATSTNFRNWWLACDVRDPTNAKDFYITDFSSRQKAGQDLDVAAPGSWVVGPFQLQSGQTSYFFLGGTSMASPHVAGIAALMLQKNPGLSQGQVENILQSSAIPLGAGCRTITNPDLTTSKVCWGGDATGAGLATADAALAATP